MELYLKDRTPYLHISSSFERFELNKIKLTVEMYSKVETILFVKFCFLTSHKADCKKFVQFQIILIGLLVLNVGKYSYYASMSD